MAVTAGGLIRYAKMFEEQMTALEKRLTGFRDLEGAERLRARLAHARTLAEDVRAILEQAVRESGWPLEEKLA